MANGIIYILFDSDHSDLYKTERTEKKKNCLSKICGRSFAVYVHKVKQISWIKGAVKKYDACSKSNQTDPTDTSKAILNGLHETLMNVGDKVHASVTLHR